MSELRSRALLATLVGFATVSRDSNLGLIEFVRDYLETLDWDKTPPGPTLPAEVIERTRAKYAEALQKLAGISVD